MRSPQNLLFPRLDNPNSPGLSSQDRCPPQQSRTDPGAAPHPGGPRRCRTGASASSSAARAGPGEAGENPGGNPGGNPGALLGCAHRSAKSRSCRLSISRSSGSARPRSPGAAAIGPRQRPARRHLAGSDGAAAGPNLLGTRPPARPPRAGAALRERERGR